MGGIDHDASANSTTNCDRGAARLLRVLRCFSQGPRRHTRRQHVLTYCTECRKVRILCHKALMDQHDGPADRPSTVSELHAELRRSLARAGREDMLQLLDAGVQKEKEMALLQAERNKDADTEASRSSTSSSAGTAATQSPPPKPCDDTRTPADARGAPSGAHKPSLKRLRTDGPDKIIWSHPAASKRLERGDGRDDLRPDGAEEDEDLHTHSPIHDVREALVALDYCTAARVPILS
jgi:hypothetical protein